MKALAALCLLAAALTASANLIVNPGFNQGATGFANWEGYENGSVDPTNFATASGGTATLTSYSNNPPETAFYQTFYAGPGGNPLPGGTYTWAATISNLTDPNAMMFIKVWDVPLDWGSWKGSQFQNVPLSNGVMTLTYVHDGTDLVQFGFSVDHTTGTGFELTNPTLEVVPEPSTLSLLAAAAALGMCRRARSRGRRHVPTLLPS